MDTVQPGDRETRHIFVHRRRRRLDEKNDWVFTNYQQQLRILSYVNQKSMLLYWKNLFIPI